jgi:hypothetical protein
MNAFRAKDEIRTRDPDLGKVVLYQLSYFRIDFSALRALPFTAGGCKTTLFPFGIANINTFSITSSYF